MQVYIVYWPATGSGSIASAISHRITAPVLEIQPGPHRDDARAVLRSGGAAEVHVAHRSVDREIRPVERIEGVRAELESHPGAVTLGPDVHLLHERDVLEQVRRLPEV